MFRVRVDVLVKANLAFGIEDTDVHFLGVQVDSAIILVLFGVGGATFNLPSLGGGLK